MNEWIEVRIASDVDAGEVLGRFNDPGVSGAWQDDGVIRLYWPVDRWAPEVMQTLRQVVRSLDARTDPAITVDRLPNQDWNARWAASVKPIRIGRRLVIRPSWQAAVLGPDEIELIIDPKQAFGTGHHATTQLLAEWLEDLIRGGERVLDLGTGSGILAMAALRLGAETAVGVDCDSVAIDCAREYASANGFGPELRLVAASLAESVGEWDEKVDVVLANLDRRTLLDSAAILGRYASNGALLLLSGLLAEDRDEAAQAFALAGAYVRETRERDGWIGLAMHGSESCEGAC